MAEREPPSQVERHAAGHGPGRYFVVWALLIVFTITTVLTGHIDMGGHWNIALALFIATVKATLVVLFFMHMSEAAGANRVVFVVSVVFALVMMLGVFGDLLTRPAMTLPHDTPHLPAMVGELPPPAAPAEQPAPPPGH